VTGVAEADGVALGVLVGLAVGVVDAVGDGVLVGVVLGDGVADVDGVADDVGAGAVTALLVTVDRQVTREPPPLAEPLHWSTVMRSDALCVEAGATVQVTVLPPPLPEPLHWVTVAPLVEPSGLQVLVPLPSAEPMHWLTVAAVGVAPPVMLLVMSTVQATSPPPPLPEPLHWVTVATTSWNVDVTGVPQVAAPIAPVHTWAVTVELPMPVATLSVLTTVTLHRAVCPPTFMIPLHWAMGAAAADAGPLGSSTAATRRGSARSTASSRRGVTVFGRGAARMSGPVVVPGRAEEVR
jgi:hypothetical protein